MSAPRLIRAGLLAGACALFFATHVFVDYVGIRAKVVRTTIAATGGEVHATATPEVLRDLPAPFAVIARLRNDSEVPDGVLIQVDGITVCKPIMPARSAQRFDCSLDRDWNSRVPHEVTVRSASAHWSLEYLEFSTHHGSSSGLLTMVVLPATSHNYKTPAAGWIVFLWVLLTGALLLPVYPLPFILKLLHRAVVGFFGVWVAVCLLSPWVSPYNAVVNGESLTGWFAVLLAPQLYWLFRVPFLEWFAPRFRSIEAPSAAEDARLFAAPGEPVWRKAAEVFIAGVAFSALVAAVTWPHVTRLDLVPDLGDPLFSVWRIAWIAHQIVRDPIHLFDGNMFYPEHLTLALSDPVIVPGLMSAPFFWLGAHPLTIYTLLFLSGFAFSGVTTYLLVRALTGRRDAAAISGIIFALYPYRFEHYSHLELQMTMWMPLALLGLHRTLVSGRRRDGLLTGLAVALQTLSSLYYGLFLLVFMGALGTVLWFKRGRPMAPVRALMAGALVLGVLVAPVAVEFIRNRATFSERSTAEVTYYSATSVDFLKPHIRSRVYGAWSANGFPERQLFPGLVGIVLAAIALWPPLKTVRFAYGVALAVAFEGSLGMNGVLFPLLRIFVPPFRGLRVPARFSILVGLALAILAGLAVARILERLRGRRVLAWGALAALATVDLLPRLELEPVWRDPPAIYAGLPTAPPAVLAEFPVPPDWRTFWFDARYIYFSTFHWQRLVNGNSGVSPPSYLDFIDHVQTFPDDESIEYLRARGVQYIGVHGAFYAPEDWRRVQAALGARTDLEIVTSAAWQGSESRLYRLKR